MNINLKKLSIQNFKGCRNRAIDLPERAEICGANATGKTTIADAFTWLLFGKDSSGNEKFDIRPLDADGNKIHNVEIMVEGVFDIEYGDEHHVRTLKKTQKEKWVKKRGSDVSELQGNENKYELDGYPRTEKEYKELIASWLGEDTFKIITNPMYFASMPWKDRRAILMLLVADMTDLEFAKSVGGFDDLIGELETAPSTDAILAKHKQKYSELKKKQAELPVRIDEVLRGKQEVNLSDPAGRKAELMKSIADEKAALVACDAEMKAVMALKQETVALRQSANSMLNLANADMLEKRMQDKVDLTTAKSNLYTLESKVRDIEKQMADAETRIAQGKRDIEQLDEEIRKERDAVCTADTTCPTCGQPLPQERVRELRDQFERDRTEYIAKYEANKDSVAKSLDLYEQSLISLRKEYAEVAEERAATQKKAMELEAAVNAAPAEVSMDDNADYQAVLASIHENETKEREMLDSLETRARTHHGRLRQYEYELSKVDTEISKAENNAKIDARVSDLQGEQREVAQMAMNCEKMIALTEEFIKARMDSISEQVNKRFGGGIGFKLFDVQINGGIKETCDITIDGVPWDSANNGHKIVAGMEIAKVMQEVYGVSAPMFVDNAEAVNSFNYPRMENQMIFLKVTEDAELKVGEA